MSNAAKDQNSKNSIILASKDDGVTIVTAIANPSNHGICVNEGITGSDNGNNGGIAMLDENDVPVWTALSSDDDGTVVEVYGDPLTKYLLIKSA